MKIFMPKDRVFYTLFEQVADTMGKMGKVLKEVVKETDFDTLLKAALENLPPKCREVFILSRVSNLTYKQISDTLGISIKTVENQMGKALKILRAYIRQKQEIPAIVSILFMILSS